MQESDADAKMMVHGRARLRSTSVHIWSQDGMAAFVGPKWMDGVSGRFQWCPSPELNL